VTQLRACFGSEEVTVADFSHLPTRSKFLAFMPQWEFLNFLAEHAQRYPTFHLRTEAAVSQLIEADDGRILGVRATTPDGPLEVRAPLVVGADGRHSTVRARAGLAVRDLGAPIDVLWMRVSRHADDLNTLLGRFDRGRVLVMLYRGDFWQCAFIIPKGGYDEVRRRGLDAFRREISEIAPFLADRLDDLRDWDDIKLLSVRVDRLERWYRPGLLCIGDAAHAMSPIGGVGINLAIQDAVAAANLLARPLHRGAVSPVDLHRVQRRRMFPTRVTQRLQVWIQDRILRPAIEKVEPVHVPLPIRMLKRWPSLRRIPARVIGLGVRPEHVRTPDVFAAEPVGQTSA
jgi:2-polyprenyl-6-methoxyphenol hydroxylase-like FAD-dependent oxidoreductase